MSEAELEKYRRLDAFLKRLGEDVYPEQPSSLHAQISRMMMDRLFTSHPPAPGSQVLDVGCGQGVALDLFAERGVPAVGITLGPDVAICRARGLNVVEMDQSFLTFEDESFGLIWCRHALEHSVFPLFTLSEFYRVLSPGGVLYLEVPAPDTACHHERNPNHYSVFTLPVWNELIQRSGFIIVDGITTSFTTPAGPDAYWSIYARKP